jgi:hypothetical protein
LVRQRIEGGGERVPELQKQLPSVILFREELESRTFQAPTFR